MNLGAMLDELRAALTGVDDGGLCAEWIAQELSGVARLEMGMGLRRGEPVDSEAVERARAWARRVAAGEPIQYVLGWTSFRGHRIRTDRRALIPRPETEELVSYAGERLTGSARIADVGTGTGCIAIALCLEHGGATVLALDREADALALAAENVATHGLQERVELKMGDLLEGIGKGTLDVVVSNPPYVMDTEFPELPGNVRDHEPEAALVSGPEGLDVIRRLIPQAHRCLRPGGSLLMEIGERQAGAVVELMVQAGFAEVEVHRDLAGRDRIVTGMS